MSGSRRLGRRQLLLGASGATLALPFLPSLLERGAAADPTALPRNFVCFKSSHGGASSANMYPVPAPNTTVTSKYPVLGHEIRSSPLPSLAVSGGQASLSPILTGDATLLTPALAAKLNVIQGLDCAVAIGHNTAGILGDYSSFGSSYADTVTIDQIMAWSSSFYTDLSTIKVRYINTCWAGGPSMTWTDPSTRTGVQVSSWDNNNLNWFNKIFVSGASNSQVPIVDQVLEDYQRLRNGNTRLSAEDRSRLDDHMQRIAELQRRLNAHVSCGNVTMPTTDVQTLLSQSTFDVDTSLQIEAQKLANDVVVAAMICGTCRIAVLDFSYNPDDTIHGDYSKEVYDGPGGGEDWHHGIAHQHTLLQQQAVLAQSYQQDFSVFLDLVSKLDAVSVTPDTTLLDQSLVFWSQECGAYTHESQSWPVVMAGSAGGNLKTGMFLDYRNLYQIVERGENEVGDKTYTGIPYNQWLGTCLQAMGVPRSEYESPGIGGYGWVQNPDGTGANFPMAVYGVTGSFLPFIQAGS